MRFCLVSMLKAGLLCLVLTGCSTVFQATSIKWAKFEGDQEVWPTQIYGLMHCRDGFPIYHLSQCPPNSYEVLGYIRTVKLASANTAEDERAVVQLASKQGGEAVLISKELDPSQQSETFQTDYLVIKFKPRPAAIAIENIDVFLALTAGITNDYTGLDSTGAPVHLTPRALAAERQEMIELKARLLASPELQRAR